MCTGTETSPKEIVAVPVDLTGIRRMAEGGWRISDELPLRLSSEPDEKMRLGARGAASVYCSVDGLRVMNGRAHRRCNACQGLATMSLIVRSALSRGLPSASTLRSVA